MTDLVSADVAVESVASSQIFHILITQCIEVKLAC
jgi:hypothetical protein